MGQSQAPPVLLLSAAQQGKGVLYLGLTKCFSSISCAGGASEATRDTMGQRQAPAVLLLSVAQQMLLEQGRALGTARVAGFTKQFSCTALHLESGAALGSVALVNRLLR